MAEQMGPSIFDRPMRWAQLTLVENDPGRYDPDFWLDYFERTKSEGACLSAGGCVAYYPTEVPLGYRPDVLGGAGPGPPGLAEQYGSLGAQRAGCGDG